MNKRENSIEDKQHLAATIVDLQNDRRMYEDDISEINRKISSSKLSSTERSKLNEELLYAQKGVSYSREQEQKVRNYANEKYGSSEINKYIDEHKKVNNTVPDPNVLNGVPSSGFSSLDYPSIVGEEVNYLDGSKITKNEDGTYTIVKADGTVLTTDSEGNSIIPTASTAGSGLKIEPEEQEGENLYDAVAKLNNFADNEATIMSNGYRTKIDCFFVHKYNIDKQNTIHFQYGKEVTNLSITNSLAQFGTSASVNIVDTGGIIPSVLEFQSSYYFVVCIMDILHSDDKGEPIHEEGLFYQPYIFDIEGVETISDDKSRNKIYNIQLLDIVSSTLEKSSYGGLLLQYPTFLNAQNFGEVYFTLIDYAGTIIYNNHNRKYHIPKNVYFIDDITDNINPIIKDVVLASQTIDMSCYTIMNQVFKHAVREIVPPSTFEGDKPGNFLIPILLLEEYDPVDNSYRTHFKRNTDLQMLEDVSYSSERYEIKATYIRRAYFARGIDMPFELAFNEKKCVLFECFNPKLNEDGSLHESEKNFNYMNGSSFSELNDIIQIPPNNQKTGILWKNLMMLNDTPSSATNFLVFFNWIYEVYKSKFLNFEHSFVYRELKQKMMPVNEPYFLILQQSKIDAGDAELFAKLNSITIRLKSTDIIKEALYHVGRTLKSYIFLNALAGFKTKLSMLRRPCEIIKVNVNSSDPVAESFQTPIGGINALENGYSLLYMTQITHNFSQNKAEDTIHANRICEVRK